MVGLPYKISCLLYAFDEKDRILLLHRRKEPNLGLWSPCGGKLEQATGESPHACACREAAEEMGLRLTPTDLHLTGIVSEHGYAGSSHWLMFLFEIRPRLQRTPPEHPEGRFEFFRREDLENLPIPATDREQIWPLFWRHRGGFFTAHCRCDPDGSTQWTIEDSRPALAPG